MGVSAVLRLAQWHEPHTSEPWYQPPYTGGTPVPLSESPKAAFFWYQAVAAVCDRRWVRIPGLIETLLQWKTVL